MTWNSTATVTNPDVPRLNLAKESLFVQPLELASFRKGSSLATPLAATPSGTDCALVCATPGTDAPTIQGDDPGGGSITSKCQREVVLPPEFVAQELLYVRVKGLTLTSQADDNCVVDVALHKDNRDGTVGADLSTTTAALDINVASAVQQDFVITASGLNPGDKLFIILTITGTDVANAAAIIPEIQAVELVYNVRG